MREIKLDFYLSYKDILGRNIIPGQKLCDNCRKSISDRKQIQIEASETSPTCTPKENALETCNSVLAKVAISPIKLKGGRMCNKVAYGRNKLSNLTDAVELKFKKALELPDEIILQDSKNHLRKSLFFETRMSELKTKLESCNNKEKKQLLTMLPDQMTFEEIASTLNVSKYMISESKKLKKLHGFFALPKSKNGAHISQEILNRVNNFYCDDFYSRVMPNKKNVIKISDNEFRSQRLMLLNFNELYAEYKKTYPDDKIGFTTFYRLKPKECIIAGSSGTHSICVCPVHQNFDLLIRATGTNMSYKDIVSKVVCDVNKKDCMFRICSSCPNESDVKNSLEELFSTSSGEVNECEEFFEYVQ